MKKVVDEEDLFREVRENGFYRGPPTFQELVVIAKHIRISKGYGEKNIIKELIAFCSIRDKYFNPTLSESLLIKVARIAVQKSAFRKPNFPINITQKEINKIREIKSFSAQKIFFSSIIVAKSSGNPMIFSDTKKSISYIIMSSGERLSYNKFIKSISPIARQEGIFEYVLSKHSFYKLLLFDNIGDSVIRISSVAEMDRSGELYTKFIGGVLEWCGTCETEFFKLSNNHKLCTICSEKRKKEKSRERATRHKEKN